MKFGIFLLQSAIKSAKVSGLLTNPLEMLKSAIKSAKDWQFVYMATRLQSFGSLYSRKKSVDKTAKVGTFDGTF